MLTPQPVANPNSFSASVTLALHTEGQTLTPTHISDDEIIFAQPPHLTAQSAIVEITVDGHRHTWPVRILAHPVEAIRIPVETVSANV